jgi:hypothetical protein
MTCVRIAGVLHVEGAGSKQGHTRGPLIDQAHSFPRFLELAKERKKGR